MKQKRRRNSSRGDSPLKNIWPSQGPFCISYLSHFSLVFQRGLSFFCVTLIFESCDDRWLNCLQQKRRQSDRNRPQTMPSKNTSLGRLFITYWVARYHRVRNLVIHSSFCIISTTSWVELVDIAVGHPNPSVARTDAIMTFCRSFVPVDVTEDDVAHFSGNLASDEEYFVSMQRELRQVRSSLMYLKPCTNLPLIYPYR